MKMIPTTDQMKRGEFLRSLGMSSAALMAFYCMGTSLTACSSKSDDPSASTGTTTPTTTSGLTGNTETSKGAINFTMDLTSTSFNTLKTVGNFVKVGNVIVANTKGGKYVAIQRDCSHEHQDRVAYQLDPDNFYCSAHGSTFATNGTVLVAAQSGQPAMVVYKTALSTDGNTLTVTA